MDDDLLQPQTQNPRTDEVIHVNLENEKVPTGEKQDELRDEKTKKISPAWEYFVKLEGCPVGKEKAKCRLCNVVIGCFSRNGTSAMMNHLKTVCPKSPLRTNIDKLQKTLRFEKISKEDNLHMIKAHTFSQERLRKKISLMCIKDNQPFRIVEHEGFRELLNEAEPKFKMPSRWTVARDCLKIYGEELVKLKKSLANQRVSFTTDTWTSVQNTNYMCLTAHWINDDWKMCKRILNFQQIGSHKGDAIGKMLLDLFAQWGLDRVFTITLDNASSNDKAISYLKKFLRGPEAILENKFLHMRCCAHILNLVVKDGLIEQHNSIARIRNASRYVRSSPARLEKFRKCVEREKIKCDKMVSLDVDTRWNSTFIMLEVAVRGSSKNSIMCDKVLKTLQELFDYYLNLSLKGQGDSTSKIQTNQSDDSWNDDFEKYMDDRDQGGTGKTELDVYLVDARERKGEVFDILEWWKMNSTRFPILSKIARHVLGMPVSSVASEAAFSTSGRTIDAYRSSLSPKTVEALICSQDWLRTSEIITDLRGEPEDYLQLEKLENDELKVTGNTFQYLDIDD